MSRCLLCGKTAILNENEVCENCARLISLNEEEKRCRKVSYVNSNLLHKIFSETNWNVIKKCRCLTLKDSGTFLKYSVIKSSTIQFR
jgi:hypothetical protein